MLAGRLRWLAGLLAGLAALGRLRWLGGLAALAGLLAGLAVLSALIGMHLSLFVRIWVLGLVLGDTVGPSGPI